MTIKELGFDERLAELSKQPPFKGFTVGRVTKEHKERYTVASEDGELEAELLGNLRYTITEKKDFPVVGDWLALSIYDEGKALIHAIYPRKSLLGRKAIGKSSELQAIAANLDYGVIVQAVDRDLNFNRIERYIALCNAAHIDTVVVFSKTDLLTPEQQDDLRLAFENRFKSIPAFFMSMEYPEKVELFRSFLEQGKTYGFLGSSGVGKSTLINYLSAREQMRINDINFRFQKGKHTTTHRELLVIEGGSILIDNPGMRELGMASTPEEMEESFEQIAELGKQCRYKDCSHEENSAGCNVIAAVESGEITRGHYSNYLKVMKESKHYEQSELERRSKDKEMGKMIKRVKQFRKNRKY